jgi:hypothetical protein
MAKARAAIDKALALTDEGRLVSTPMWSQMHDCRRAIEQAMDLLQAGD